MHVEVEKRDSEDSSNESCPSATIIEMVEIDLESQSLYPEPALSATSTHPAPPPLRPRRTIPHLLRGHLLHTPRYYAAKLCTLCNLLRFLATIIFLTIVVFAVLAVLAFSYRLPSVLRWWRSREFVEASVGCRGRVVRDGEGRWFCGPTI
ncbi:hypothetical protein K402DRAFT_51012 [Aulographum hederae CBS 113979]|uniref:Uncharacterized protein n=1 Tax=Aulographum hederae CBS 113979 TaxID=1176131 RepID=A0A6G1H2Y7_9PEZI|nr:hypothetical protein K402DRAFT_51012 [Aulographum hederae CBS 113979]